MLQQIIDQANPAAPPTARPRSAFRVQLGATPADVTGENRLGFGEPAINGFTGFDAHAAVCMHATPASGASWSYDREGKSVATAPSVGRLRTG